ncbi:extracellular solute-binding protein [Christensenellaceae bacterium OttesenSCG-928-L17]|nr:extracellular solute-binding protein [Christensenellaceae bacterium OttesenSCG-928-L17]
MKRTLALLLTVAMAFGVLAACQPSTPAPSNDPVETNEPPAVVEPSSPVELVVVTSYGGDDGNRANYENAYKEYEALSGNVIQDASATSNEEWKAKVVTDFETGAEPDVLFYFTGSDSNPFVSANKVVPIEEIRAEYPEFASNMKDAMMAYSPADGKQYAVPVNGYWETLFVNKKVLEAAEVSVPGADYTWDQFLLDCEKIKAAGFTPIAVSLQEVPHYWFEFVIYNQGNPANHGTLPVTADDETGLKWAKGLDDLKELYDLGYLPSNTMTAKDDETVQMFGDGKAAFLIDGSWKLGWITENCGDHIEDFTISFVPGKGERKATDIVGGMSMGYFITRKAWEDPEKRDAAVAFVSHMTSDEVVSKFAATTLSALKSGGVPQDGYNSLQEDALEMVAKSTSVVGAVQDYIDADVRQLMFNDLKNVVVGSKTAAEMITETIERNDALK